MSRSLLLLLAAPAVKGAISFSWTDCGTSGTHAKVTKVDVVPANPMPGQQINITSFANINKTTSAVKSDLVFAKLFHNKFDGCAGATIDAPLKLAHIVFPPADCPLAVQTGAVFKRYVTTSSSMPKGSTTSHLESSDQDGESFICVDMTLHNEAYPGEHLEEGFPNLDLQMK
jgi:hypothetical protein